MKIIQFLKQKILAYKYKNAPSLYIIDGMVMVF